jgi:hypothetical protein
VQRGGRRYLPFAFTEHGAIMLPKGKTFPVCWQTLIENLNFTFGLETQNFGGFLP